MTSPQDYPAALGQVFAKVEAFCAQVEARQGENIRCGAGCAGCCAVELDVTSIEATIIERHIAALSEGELERVVAVLAQADRSPSGTAGSEASNSADAPRCVALDADGRCAIYDARPLVCRSQGMALRYPEGWIPAEAVFARTQSNKAQPNETDPNEAEPGKSLPSKSQPSEVESEESAPAGEITWCPLNFTEAPPGTADVLDAEHLDKLSGLLNTAHANSAGVSPEARFPLRACIDGALRARGVESPKIERTSSGGRNPSES